MTKTITTNRFPHSNLQHSNLFRASSFGFPASPTKAFTLVEMLVVIGIIGALAALLLPAVMAAIVRARNAAIALELKSLETAIEAYRLEKGDYPPNFRSHETVRRHIAKCYPNINSRYFDEFMRHVFPPNGVSTVPNTVNPVIDEAETIVFWLSMTDTNKQYPFLSLQLPNWPSQIPLPAASPKKFFDFEETRLVPATTPASDVKSFEAKFCKETPYIYIDSRFYNKPQGSNIPQGYLCQFQNPDGRDLYAMDDDTGHGIRPYFSSPTNMTPSTKPVKPPPPTPPNPLYREQTNFFKPEKPSSFQLICAGLDGEFTDLTTQIDIKISTGGIAGENYDTFGVTDKDNITNFSNGKTLGDLIP